MAKTAEPKNSRVLAEVAGNVYSGIIAVFVCIVLGIFPLYYHDYYFDILTSKYKFYWILVVTLLAVCLLVGLVFCFVDMMEYGGVNTKSFFEKFRPENLKKQPMAYKALAAFWLFCVISTIQSDYVYESFWGNEGRFSGLFLLTLYTLGTVLVAKLGRMKRWYLDLFLFTSLLVCLFGITDYFQMDILGWKANVKEGQGDIFTSTIGNVNTYTAYVGIVLGVSCGLFVKERNLFRSIWYYVLSAIGFFAIIVGQSDNAYLALGILFVVLPFFVFDHSREIAGYAVLVSTFFTVIKLVDVISREMADRVIGFSGIIQVIGSNRLMLPFIVLLWAITVGLLFWSGKQKDGRSGKVGKWLKVFWSFLIAAASGIVLFVLFDANFLGHAERYSAISGYVVFNDTWGTNRGFCWRAAWEAYMEQPLMHKLFGYGADTFGILTWGYRQEALDRFNIYFESAHNEYLQYLVTIGPFALASYLTFLGGSIWQMMKRAKEKVWIVALFMAVLCYNAQAVVNINLPIATPIMWLMVGMGLAVCRECERERAEEAAEGASDALTAEK